MSRIATPSEKVLAVAGIVKALTTELGLNPDPVMVMMTARDIGKDELRVVHDSKPEITWLIPPPVMAALIDAATRIAMGTDTRDMGIMLAAHDKAVADFNNNGCVSDCPPEGHYEECELYAGE